MTDAEIINKALLLMKKECSKHTSYSACDICPFGFLCKNDIGYLIPSDIDKIISKYIEYNTKL